MVKAYPLNSKAKLYQRAVLLTPFPIYFMGFFQENFVDRFFQENFVDPLLSNGWFNPFNTILYGVILLIGIYGIYKLLDKLNVKTDWKFFLAIFPFIFWASTTRAIRDFIYKSITNPPPGFTENIVVNYSTVYSYAYDYIINIIPFPPLASLVSTIIAYFPTPGSYLITFLFALVTLLISLGIQKISGIKYWKPMFIIALLAFIYNIIILPIHSIQPLTYILPLTAFWLILFFGISKLSQMDKLGPKMKRLFSYENYGVLNAHLLDATATFTSLSFFGYAEQHFVPRFFMGFLGNWVFFPIKIVVVLIVLWFIDSYTDDKNLRTYLKIIIVILGLSPAIRDIVTLLL